MSSGANVHSIEAIEIIKAAYCKLVEEGRLGLDAMRLELRRFMNWLEREQVEYWKMQLKHAREELAEARNALMRKRISGGSGETPRATEEKIAVQKAQRRQEEAEQKLRLLDKWKQAMDREILLYEGRARQLDHFLEVDAVNGIAHLDRILDALDAYIRTAPPLTAISGGPQSSAASEAPVASVDQPVVESHSLETRPAPTGSPEVPDK